MWEEKLQCSAQYRAKTKAYGTVSIRDPALELLLAVLLIDLLSVG